MTDSEKMDLQSVDIAEEKRSRLQELFPEVFTEGQKIDFERLKLTLGESVDVGKERYGMNWPGKADCFKIIQQPSIATLTPAREESVNFDETENIFIEGDNLEALKLLQKAYLGKVKVIEIDPPYNTGNDFIYPDNYTENLDTYLRYTGQIDDEGRKYSTNTEADGRFHSKWLNMMYPRLFLARNLLREDGVIFIHIDDHEVDNLRKLCDEIFGEENFVATFIWEKRTNRENRKVVSLRHDYIICYSKIRNKETKAIRQQPMTEKALSSYKNPDNDARGLWKSDPATAQAGHGTKGQFYVLKAPNGKLHELESGRCWLYTEDVMQAEIDDGHIWFGKDGNGVPRIKTYLDAKDRGLTPESIWFAEDVSTNEFAKNQLKELFDGVSVFETPKPVDLIKLAVQISSENGIVMDFFSGSCVTAHAVLDLNKQDGGNRKFIMVQLPEPCAPDSEAFKVGYKTIADIGKERIRRVIGKIREEQEQKKDLFSDDKPKLDLGFKVFKLEPSNFKLWNDQVAKDKDAIKNQLEMFVEHINPQSSQEDILYELLLKSGFPLATKIEQLSLADKSVFSINEGAMLICLKKDLTPEVIKEMAEKKPSRVICLDEGFHSNDQLKTNAVQIMKSKDIIFRTV